MKCNLIGLIILSFGSLLLLSGCTNKSFFSTEGLMKAPKLTKAQKEIKNVLTSYIGDEIVWKHCEVNDRYCALFEDEWGDNANSFIIAFCQSISDSQTLHIVFIFKENNHYKAVGEILSKTLSIEKIQIKDINNDGKNEILIYPFSVNKDSSLQVSIYSYDESGIVKLDY